MLGRQREGTSKLLSLPLVASKTGVEIEETLDFNTQVMIHVQVMIQEQAVIREQT